MKLVLNILCMTYSVTSCSCCAWSCDMCKINVMIKS